MRRRFWMVVDEMLAKCFSKAVDLCDFLLDARINIREGAKI